LPRKGPVLETSMGSTANVVSCRESGNDKVRHSAGAP
jgi:hypothetical protein